MKPIHGNPPYEYREFHFYATVSDLNKMREQLTKSHPDWRANVVEGEDSDYLSVWLQQKGPKANRFKVYREESKTGSAIKDLHGRSRYEVGIISWNKQHTDEVTRTVRSALEESIAGFELDL